MPKSAKQKPEKPAPVGRPTDYDQKLIDRICERVALGENINVICEDRSMPSPETVYKWRRENKEFSDKYFDATQERSHARIDRIDGITRKVELGQLEPAAAAVILKAETWQAGRENPKRYGDKQAVDLTSNGQTLGALIEQTLGGKSE